MKFKDLYLPIGLVVAFICGFIFTNCGNYLFHWNYQSIKLSEMIIFFIFIISGYQLKLDNFKFDRNLGYTLLGGATINLLLAPCFALLLIYFIPLENSLKIGVLTIACVPPTMASGIISTDIAKGNTLWAIIFTIILNAVGVLVIPFTFSHMIQLDAANQINSLVIFKKLFFLVLLPAFIGYLIKRKYGGSKHFLLTYFQPTAIIFVAFCTVAAGKENLLKISAITIIFLLITVITLHLILIGMCLLLGKLKKLAKENTIAITFVCSQKTLPLALALLMVLPKEIASIASISCLLYHLSQVFIDSFIAYFWQKKSNIK